MSDLASSFIAPAFDAHAQDRVVRFSTKISLTAENTPIRSALLRYTALGVVEARIDDVPTSPALLTPGWTSYEWRLRVAEEDVTGRVKNGSTIDLRLAPGWYAGRLGWGGNRSLYGDRPAVAAQLIITYDDGTVQVIATDGAWESSIDPSTSADLYDGETIDARISSNQSAGRTEVVAVQEIRFDDYLGPPIERLEEIAPGKVFRSRAGRVLVDFGENLVGWTRLRVQGTAGHVIEIRHAEVLEEGELGTRPLRSAQATDRFILSGRADEFEPTFTLHGFQFAEVRGWPGTDEELASAIRAIRVGSRLRRTGTFTSSNALLNSFHGNVVRGLLGNFVGLPTDCPQRDERLGWTGDIAVFAPTATFLFDVQDFLSDWLVDVHEETTHAGGIVPFVVPDSLKLEPGASGNPVLGSPDPTAIWGDAAVWVPWSLFQRDADLERLASHYAVMTAHGEAVASVLSDDGTWDHGFQFGDWLDPAAPPEDPAAALTPTALVATASGARTFALLRDTSTLLEKHSEAARFGDLAARMRNGFRRRYVRDGILETETVTAYSLAIVFGLFDADELPLAGVRLSALVRANKHTISTGFAGTPFVTEALSMTGHIDDAYALLLQEECPSWLYAVRMGATTVWERWDSMLPDGSINPGEMTSFNHYALGSVADWIHRHIGGIAPAEPGYAAVLVAPSPGGGIQSADTSLELTEGNVRVRWDISDGILTVTADLPVNGVLRIPGMDERQVGPGTHVIETIWPSPQGDQ
ncbi:alpha-L-rhamnosidase [Pseudoclavibacter terrae]|uniref:alpha-L-rhamnosidase n=1 Tax=Pseudoclavibacter terrae TaxID=1530195 RepID=UPI00142E9498|nr:alpha-L-rhamnosidase [Pseudoclavibacter terrae]